MPGFVDELEESLGTDEQAPPPAPRGFVDEVEDDFAKLKREQDEAVAAEGERAEASRTANPIGSADHLEAAIRGGWDGEKYPAPLPGPGGSDDVDLSPLMEAAGTYGTAAALAPVGGLLGRLAGEAATGLGEWVGGVWRAGRAAPTVVEGLGAAARQAGPGLMKAAPVVEGLMLGEKGGPQGGLAGEAAAVANVEGKAAEAVAEEGRQLVQRLGGKAKINWDTDALPPAGFHTEFLAPAEVMAKTEAWQRLDPVTGKGQSGIPGRLAGVKSYVETGRPMTPPRIVVDKSGSVAFSDGRHRTVAAIQAGEGKIPFYVEDPVQRLGAAGRARQGERGAAILPDVGKRIRKGLTMHPGLDNVPMPDNPNIDADYAIAMNSAIGGAEGDIAAVQARNIRLGDPAMAAEFEKVLKYRNLSVIASEQMTAGRPVKIEGGLSAAQAMAEATGAEARLRAMPGGDAYFTQAMRKTNDMRRGMSQYAIATNQMDPRSVHPEYIPTITEGKFQDKNIDGLVPDSEAEAFVRDALAGGGAARPGGLPGGPGQGMHAPIPAGASAIRQGREKMRLGSTDTLVGDSLDRLSLKAAAGRRKGRMNQFAERLKPLSITDDVKAGRVTFDSDLHGVYYYGNGQYQIFPKKITLPSGEVVENLARSIAEAGQFKKPEGYLPAALVWANNKMRKGILGLNPSFLSKQMADDPVWGAINVPFGEKGRTLVDGYKNFLKAWREIGNENAGIPSPMLNEWRRHGSMNEVYETLTRTVDEVKQISDKTKVGKGLGFFERISQAREAGSKEAQYQAWMRQAGVTSENAARAANRASGNFIYKSPLGRELGEVMPMKKWYVNAIRILTVDAFKDPITNVRNARGVSSSPWTVMAPAAVAALAWNTMVTKGKNTDMDGLIVPGTSYKVQFPGFGSLIKSAGDFRRHPAEEMGRAVTPSIMAPLDYAGRTKYWPGWEKEAERFAAPLGQARRILSPQQGERSAAMDILKTVAPVQVENWKRAKEFRDKREHMGHSGKREE